jgi:hypothetical protein
MMIEKHDDATCRVMGQPCASKTPNASVYLSKSCGSFRACNTLLITLTQTSVLN